MKKIKPAARNTKPRKRNSERIMMGRFLLVADEGHGLLPPAVRFNRQSAAAPDRASLELSPGLPLTSRVPGVPAPVRN
jgi:hypothetical protein